MTFDIKKFESTKFKDRIISIPVPNLAAFFGKKEKPVWKVRGMTGIESATAKQAVANNRNIDAVLDAVGSNLKKNITEGVKELANLSSDSVPDEMVQRYSWLTQASVKPVCTQRLAMKLAENFPEEFYKITNSIIQATGKGRLGE